MISTSTSESENDIQTGIIEESKYETIEFYKFSNLIKREEIEQFLFSRILY